MIFATVGSHPTYRFERLLLALESLSVDELVVQHGPGSPPANATAAAPWMTFAEIADYMDRADHVVSHAGAGTILCAVQAGQVPIVFPRLQRFGETVDDHQLELARRLAEDGRVVVIENEADLAAALDMTPARGVGLAVDAGKELIGAVRRELVGPG